MSNTPTQQRSGGHNDQQPAAGSDFYNPHTPQDLYDREFNSIQAGLSDVRRNSRKIINDNADTVREKESNPTKHAATPVLYGGKTAKIRQLFTSKKLRGKTSLITIMLVLFGGGGAVTIFTSPALAAVQLRQALTQDLNDQLKSFENRHAYLMRSKFKTLTQGSCGVVKTMPCRMAKISDTQAERFKNKGITIDTDRSGRITRMVFPGSNGEPDVEVTSGRDLHTKMLNNMTVRTGLQRVENPWFASMTDKTFKTALRLLGASKASRISGDTNEEREKSVNNVIGQSSELDVKDLTPETDKDGKKTGRYIGPDGAVLTQQQIDMVNESARTVESATKIKPSNIASSIGKGVIATGAVDTACTVYNASRMVGALAKTEKAKQAAQMATATLLVPADKLMAGMATDGETEFVGNKINNIGGQKQPEKIVDETKLYDAGTSGNPPMKDNQNLYATAFDSPGVKAALYGDVIPLDSSQARFSLAGGFVGTLSKVNEYIARVVNGGDPNPREVSRKCGYVQNPYVRGTALIAGILVGVGSFGTFQAASIASSLAISMALPYAVSMAADIASGDMFKNLYGMDFGSGAFVGTAAVMSTAAQRRGMKPLSASEAVAYTQSNNESLARYADTEHQLAKQTPFDIYNRYSFIGSIASHITPVLNRSQSSAGIAALNIMHLLPTSLATLTGTAKADTTIERFQQCHDPGYAALGIGADIYCNVRYGLSSEELAMDPISNATWMMDTGNIARDNDTGEALDNGQKWNYKKFMEECANRTVGYGENQEENQGDGSNCLSRENEALNRHFRVFTMDLSVADYMDGVDDEAASIGDGEQGSVSTDGWAYPTTKDAKISSGYKPTDRPDHRGIDMYHDGGSLGKPIFAARDGKVTASGPATGFGNWIVIEHDVDGKKMSSVYGHMRASDLLVRVGDTVKAGQQIARIGNEGQSSGPHLHFEIWNGNRQQCSDDCSINPAPIIEKAKRTTTTREERM